MDGLETLPLTPQSPVAVDTATRFIRKTRVQPPWSYCTAPLRAGVRTRLGLSESAGDIARCHGARGVSSVNSEVTTTTTENVAGTPIVSKVNCDQLELVEKKAPLVENSLAASNGHKTDYRHNGHCAVGMGGIAITKQRPDARPRTVRRKAKLRRRKSKVGSRGERLRLCIVHIPTCYNPEPGEMTGRPVEPEIFEEIKREFSRTFGGYTQHPLPYRGDYFGQTEDSTRFEIALPKKRYREFRKLASNIGVKLKQKAMYCIFGSLVKFVSITCDVQTSNRLAVLSNQKSSLHAIQHN